VANSSWFSACSLEAKCRRRKAKKEAGCQAKNGSFWSEGLSVNISEYHRGMFVCLSGRTVHREDHEDHKAVLDQNFVSFAFFVVEIEFL
jgi:hypothetical protein